MADAALAPLPRFLAVLFFVTVMLSIGLRTTREELVDTLRRRGLLARSVLANLVLVPLLALAITRVIPLPDHVGAGILLVAAAPGGLTALQFTTRARGALAFAATLAWVLCLLAIVFTPLLARLVLPPELHVALPYGRVFTVLALYLLLPLLLGVAARQTLPAVARVLARPVILCANLSFVASVLVTMGLRQQATRAIGLSGVVAMLAVIVGSMVLGWLLGGPGVGTRTVLATGTSVRNVALALLVALKSLQDTSVDVTVAAFGALMVPPNMLFTLYQTFKARRRPEAADAPAERAA